MNCQNVRKLLSAYLDHETTGQEMLEIRQHISACQECQAELEEFRAVKSALSVLNPVPVSPLVAEEIKNSVLPKERKRVKQNWNGIALVAATVALASAFAFAVYVRTQQPAHSFAQTEPASEEVVSTPTDVPNVPLRMVSSD